MRNELLKLNKEDCEIEICISKERDIDFSIRGALIW